MTNRILVLNLSLLFLLSLFVQNISAQKNSPIGLKGGFKIQKTQKLYWENGLTFDFTHEKLLDKKIHFGLSYVSSRLGSAINSNAIKQDNFHFTTTYHLRNTKKLQPIGRINIGYFSADYEEEIFDVLPNSSFIFSLEGGLSYDFTQTFSASLSAGYNLNTGNGIDGPGTLYPLFYQMSLLFAIIK